MTTPLAPTTPVTRAAGGGPITIQDADRMADQLVSHLRSTVPPFTALPRPLLNGDVKAVTRQCMRWTVQRCNGGTVPEQPTSFLRTAASRWTRADIPIEQVLRTMHIGVEAGLDMLLPRLGEPSYDRVITWTRAAMELSDLCTATISKAYTKELDAASVEHRISVHTLASALLGGRASSKIARECGIPIDDEYYVLAVYVAPHPDESRTDLDGRVVAGRKLRRIQSALTHHFHNRALATLSTEGGTVLVPTTACTEHELVHTIEATARHTGSSITAIMTRCATAAIPAAATQTHELLTTAESIGIGPGLHKFDDLALQYQLTRPGIGRHILQSRIAPLDAHPELLRTLRVFFNTDMNRRLTARQLNIHPNTIDYRLRRIAQLTGLNPSRSDGRWYLRSALIAGSARDTTTRPPPEHPRRTA